MASTKLIPEILKYLKRRLGNNSKSILVMLPLVLFIGPVVFYKPLKDLSSNFLTDTNIFLNLDFYKILYERIVHVSGEWVIMLLLISIFFIAITKQRVKGRFIIISLFTGSIIYLLIASKSIRYALYYNHIFTILFIFCITFLFNYLLNGTRLLNSQRNIIITSLTVLIFTYFFLFEDSVFKQNKDMRNFEVIANYITENTSPNDKVLRLTSKMNALYLYTNRPMILLSGIPNNSEYLNRLRNDITHYGFAETMYANNIHYLVTYKSELDLTRILYIFTDKINQNAYDRTSLIANDLTGNENFPSNSSDIYNSINPGQYFQIEKEFGNVQIFKIINPDQTV